MDQFTTDISEINTILLENEIPIIIEIVDKTIISGIEDEDCDPFLGDDTIYYLLKNINLEDNIGYIGIDQSENCIYINYLCIFKKYRSVSLSAFLAYIAIFLGIKNNKKYIFSVGVAKDTVEAPYERIIGKEWVLSQGILINKFGFKDGYKLDTYNEGKLRGINEICGNYAETYLDLKGDISKYEAYHHNFSSDPRTTIFKKYLDKFVSSSGAAGGGAAGGKSKKIRKKKYSMKKTKHTKKRYRKKKSTRKRKYSV